MKDQFIYCVFLLFHFCDTDLEVPLTSMNMYNLELTPESYKSFKSLCLVTITTVYHKY